MIPSSSSGLLINIKQARLSLSLFHRSPDSHALSSRSLVVFAPFLTTFATGSLAPSNSLQRLLHRPLVRPERDSCLVFLYFYPPAGRPESYSPSDTLRSSVSLLKKEKRPLLTWFRSQLGRSLCVFVPRVCVSVNATL